MTPMGRIFHYEREDIGRYIIELTGREGIEYEVEIYWRDKADNTKYWDTHPYHTRVFKEAKARYLEFIDMAYRKVLSEALELS